MLVMIIVACLIAVVLLAWALRAAFNIPWVLDFLLSIIIVVLIIASWLLYELRHFNVT